MPREVLIPFIFTILGLLLFTSLVYLMARSVSYYTFRSVEEQLTRSYHRRRSGIEGEETVAHDLSFLPAEYRVLHNLYIEVPGRAHGQQIDHVVIGPNGLFHIETKNQNGKITITRDGQWLIKRGNRQTVGMRNPVAQVLRHELMLKEYLALKLPGKEIPMQGLVVFSRPEIVFRGLHNSPVKVLRSDQLQQYIPSADLGRTIPPGLLERIYFVLQPAEDALPDSIWEED